MRLVLVACAAGALAVGLAVAASERSDGSAPEAAQDTALHFPVTGVRIAAAGDIACAPGRAVGAHTCRQRATSDSLVRGRYAKVLALGDLQYEEGTADAFRRSYDLTWGRVRNATAPVPGNHEYHTPGAAGYFGYFGNAAGDPSRGYYSFDVGGWHVVALNSNCSSVRGCGKGSPQVQWLRSDLEAHPTLCTLAYWHHPRFSSGQHGNDATYAPFWRALAEAGVDVVLTGHDHDYERFAPQDPDGERDRARGIRAFVVGTGGKSLRDFRRIVANSEVRDASSFGVLELTLGRRAYSWRFRPAVGAFTDSGSTVCHRRGSTIAAP